MGADKLNEQNKDGMALMREVVQKMENEKKDNRLIIQHEPKVKQYGDYIELDGAEMPNMVEEITRAVVNKALQKKQELGDVPCEIKFIVKDSSIGYKIEIQK